MAELPTSLYKYFPPERLDALRTGRFRYSQFGAFNDPFEGRPEITSITSEATASEALKAILPSECARGYAELPRKVRMILSYEMYEKAMRGRFADAEREMIQQLLRPPHAIQREFSAVLDREVGVFCLCEVPDNLLMWSHYAATHSGFVLEFDATHPYFHAQLGPTDELRHLRPVEYREARPSAPLSELVGSDILLAKGAQWAYEREWRILRPLRDAAEVLDDEPFDIHLFEIPHDAVKAIVLGARVSADTAKSTNEILHRRQALGHVRVMQAVLSESGYGVKIIDDGRGSRRR